MKSQIQFTERHSRITNKKIDNSGMHLWKGTHQFSHGLMIDETVRDNLLKNSKIDRKKIQLNANRDSYCLLAGYE